jgi:hypothetical protein
MSYLRHYLSTTAHKWWVAIYLINFLIVTLWRKLEKDRYLTRSEIEDLSLHDLIIYHTSKHSALLAKSSFTDSTDISMLCLNTGKVSLRTFVFQLLKRAIIHDISKYSISESKGFSRLTHELKKIEYGTPQYKLMLAKLRPTIDLHYSRNPHHPEYHGSKNILNMNLFDFVEMFYDWKAAGRRGKDGDISKSILVQQAKLGLETYTVAILINTI